MIPKRLITTWICDPPRDRYQQRHRDMFSVCIDSWLRLMPDYEIVVITYGTLLHIADEWLTQRLAEGNFIAASQWARLYALYTVGGIFMDADVQAVRRYDSLLDKPYTLGHLGNGQQFANNAVMAVEAKHPFLIEQMQFLQGLDPNHPDFGNISGPFMVSRLLNRRGWAGADVESEVDGITVRRSAVFYPYNWNQTFSTDMIQPDTLAVHHWASSWKPLGAQPQHAWRPQ